MKIEMKIIFGGSYRLRGNSSFNLVPRFISLRIMFKVPVTVPVPVPVTFEKESFSHCIYQFFQLKFGSVNLTTLFVKEALNFTYCNVQTTPTTTNKQTTKH
jgi:hypothetical protein